MNLETALQKKDKIAAFLNIDRVKRRSARPRPNVAIGVAPGRTGIFQIAIRAWSVVDLENAFGEGIGDEVRAMADDEVDLQITGAIEAAPANEAPLPLRLGIGASVGHYNCTAGSLGFFAQHKDYSVGFVSNNHVLADCDNGVEGDDILHPAPMDGGHRTKDVVGKLVAGYPRLQKNAVVVDAAFARLGEGVEYDPCGIGSQLRLKQLHVPLYKQLEVMKLGRSTGLTRGRISAFALQNLDVDYRSINSKICFDRQIEIASEDTDHPFSRPGDSGSLVVNPEGHAIGLLFAGNGDGRFAYANPINDVLRELNVTLLT